LNAETHPARRTWPNPFALSRSDFAIILPGDLTALKWALRYKTLSRKKIEWIIERVYLGEPPEFVRVHGIYIYLNPQDTEVSARIAKLHVWERRITRGFLKLIRRGSLVVDAGANIGWYTLLSAHAGCKVHAFEPDPVSFSLLSKSVERNNFTDVALHNSCLLEYDGEAKLSLSNTRDKGKNSVVWRYGENSLNVPCAKLDTLFPVETIDVLKIDVEGAEPNVISGARKMIGEGRIRRVILEWKPRLWMGEERSLLRGFAILGKISAYQGLSSLASFSAWQAATELPSQNCYLALERRKAEED
jgi:FkbM family methyltransferase